MKSIREQVASGEVGLEEGKSDERFTLREGPRDNARFVLAKDGTKVALAYHNLTEIKLVAGKDKETLHLIAAGLFSVTISGSNLGALFDAFAGHGVMEVRNGPTLEIGKLNRRYETE